MRRQSIHISGKPARQYFSMDSVVGGRVEHPTMLITVHGNIKTVEGKINQAVQLNGTGQYLDLGEQQRSCLGNLMYCSHGLSASMWVNFHGFQDNMYYVSTGINGVNMFYRDGQLHIEVGVVLI